MMLCAAVVLVLAAVALPEDLGVGGHVVVTMLLLLPVVPVVVWWRTLHPSIIVIGLDVCVGRGVVVVRGVGVLLGCHPVAVVVV